MFDSEALSKAARGDETVAMFVKAAARNDVQVVTSALTTLEAWDPKAGVLPAAWDWTMSRIQVVHTTDDLIGSARSLLKAARLHGHKYAIDAVLGAVALAAARRGERVIVLTSDADDLRRLLDDHPVWIEPV
ncbi:hypothetical protein [Streptomyces sp. NPDC059564]|uniref:hypothetical protein n=1 Tax=Streptomyces sp. NPDC059564 TaxID=3346865 RepID=UPI003685687B